MKESLSKYTKIISLSFALAALPIHEVFSQNSNDDPLAASSIVAKSPTTNNERLDPDAIIYWTMVSYNKAEIRHLELVMKDVEYLGKQYPFDKTLLSPHIEALEQELDKALALYDKYFKIIDEGLSQNITLDTHRLEYYTKQKEKLKKYYDDLCRIYNTKNL